MLNLSGLENLQRIYLAAIKWPQRELLITGPESVFYQEAEEGLVGGSHREVNFISL